MRKRSRGAVTVFVTLLLIPAILVSGSGVDLARIYAARGVARDANQLAANALLTEYDATLQDLYGLYAVIDGDDKLVQMVDAYVKASLFGEDVTDAQLGEFRLFWGKEAVTSTVETSDPLSNLEILRRQIEEYSKYRVPVAIVKEVLERLGNESNKEMAANNEAVAKKLAVDEQLEEVLVKFNDVIDKADQLVDSYQREESSAYTAVNKAMGEIRTQLADMLSVRQAYEEETDPKKRDDLLAHFNAIAENITSCVQGGSVGRNWVPAYVDDDGNDVPGGWQTPEALFYTRSLQDTINRNAEKLEGHCAKLDELVQLCQEADAAKGKLRQRIDELEAKLNDGTCSAELVSNMREELKDAKKLLDYDFTDLGTQMKNAANKYINNISAKTLKDIQGYGTPGGAFISFENLKNVTELPGFKIDFNVNPALYQNEPDRLQSIQSALSTYTAPQAYPSFQNISNDHKAVYELIKNGKFLVKSEGELSNEEKERKANVKKLFEYLGDIWNGLTDYQPAPGADGYPNAAANSWAFSQRNQGMELDFGLGALNMSDSGEGNIAGTLKTFTNLISGNMSIGDFLGGVLDNAADRILLVGYSTQMFSNWTTKYTGEPAVSLTGQEINASNNYFLHSEWEYLVNGNVNAGSNLGKITLTLLGLRFVANYASSYMISQVNDEIHAYEELVSAIPYVGGVLRFLVRPLVVFGESVLDVSLLRTGHSVPLLKKDADQWKFSITGFTMEIYNQLSGSSEESGMFYTDYLIAFMLISDPNVLASRVGDLIALNVTTNKHHIAENDKNTKGTDERAGAISNVQLFDLSKAFTTFAVETKTQVRFTFLSMPFAQQGVNGIVPPTTFPVNVTTYRGY